MIDSGVYELKLFNSTTLNPINIFSVLMGDSLAGEKEMILDTEKSKATKEEFSVVMLDGVLTKVTTSDLWFYSDSFQKALKKAESEIKNGKCKEFDNADDFIDSLFE